MPPRRPTIPILSVSTSHSLPPSNIQIQSTPSVSATSDVRRRMSQSTVKAEDDYTRIPPDEMFVRFTVAEVKTIQQRLRADADAKQEQLRLMVGEQYRDLLQASTSIISISQSSQRVFEALSDIAATCTSEAAQASSAGQSSRRKSQKDDQQLPVLQSLSAHLKLLLDAPEQIWRLLEKQMYLHAAWLFLLSRVVYRGLTREGEQDDETEAEISWEREGINISEQFPLIQRQWDTLSQFRTQIAHKATQSLREGKSSTADTAQTLLSILLLDSIPLSDTLSLLLSQRSKSLQTLYAKVKILSPPTRSSSLFSTQVPTLLDPSVAKKNNGHGLLSTSLLASSGLPSESSLDSHVVTNGTLQRQRSRNKKELFRDVKHALRQVLQLIGATMKVARDLFIVATNDAGLGGEHGLSLIEELLAEMQLEPASEGPITITKADRRLSTFFSQPVAPSPSQTRLASSAPVLSTAVVLGSLPSSQLLTRFLPISIKSYVPYVDTTSPSARLSTSAAQSLTHSWFRHTLDGLEAKLMHWVQSLDRVDEVWALRDLLKTSEMGFSDDEEKAVSSLIEKISIRRISEIWQFALNGIVLHFRHTLDTCVAKFQEGIAERANDVNPSSFLFRSSLPMSPRPPSDYFASKLPSTTTSSFDAYKSALRQRVTFRTPVLDSVLSELEDGAKSLQSDLQAAIKEGPSNSTLIHEMRKQYSPAARACANSVIKELRDRLDPNTKNPVNGKAASHDTESRALVLLGNVAHKLVSSSFIHDLGCDQESTAHLHGELRGVYEQFLQKWISSTISVTTPRSPAAIQNHTIPASNKGVTVSATSPSNDLMEALFALGSSLDSLGLSRTSLEETGASRKLLSAFAIARSSEYGRKQDEDVEQAFVDNSFLLRLCQLVWQDQQWKEPQDRLEETQLKLSAQIKSARGAKAAARLAADSDTAITETLSRTQVLFGVLLWTNATPHSQSSTTLLPFGTPSPEQSQQVPLAKPGQRFGQLLVGNSSGR